jgi:hypothetical protein
MSSYNCCIKKYKFLLFQPWHKVKGLKIEIIFNDMYIKSGADIIKILKDF